MAFNYGGKAEIAEAVKRIAAQVAAGKLAPDQITEEMIGAALYTAGMPDPDIIIRTSGEQRVSNFLLWQAAYAELIFVEENWPDFNERSFVRALEEYSGRDRRFRWRRGANEVTAPGPSGEAPARPSPSWADLGPRVVSALVIIAVIAIGLYFGGYVWAALRRGGHRGSPTASGTRW